MIKIFTFLLSISFAVNSFCQIGGGWDWAKNTGSLGPNAKFIGYNSSGEMVIVASALGATYLGGTTITAPDVTTGVPGNISYLAKISSTGTTTILRTFINPYFTLQCATLDASGNIYVGLSYSAFGDVPIDLGNGVTLQGLTKVAIVKFSPTGTTLLAKSFDLGVTNVPNSTANLDVLKIAVSSTGNIFFVGGANNPTSNPGPYSINKLDANGNMLWAKYATGMLGKQGPGVDNDKFIDDQENVYLFTYTFGTSTTFNGELLNAPLYTNGSNGYSFYYSLDANGNKRWSQGYRSVITNLVVDRPTNSVFFGFLQFQTNTGPFTNLPKGTYLPTNADAWIGIVKTDINNNLLIAGSKLPQTFFIPLSNGRLLIGLKDFKGGIPLGFGVDYVFPVDNTNDQNILVVTDASLNQVKAIAGGKAIEAGPSLMAALGDTYGMVADFNTSASALPTSVYGSTTLTGFNAAANLTTAYGVYSSLRSDQAYVQCKDANFPAIAATTWLGINGNWNDAANWSNGIPTAQVKTVFNTGATNYPSTFSAPTTGTLQVNSGATITLPATFTIGGSLQNNGTIKIENAGFFQGLGAAEWLGNGMLEFSGTTAPFYFFAKPFTNSITINSGLNTFYDITVPGVVLKGGKFDLGTKRISLNTIEGASSTSYFTNGILQRNITPNGTFEFPIGTTSNYQPASITTNNLSGVKTLAANFTNGAITGTQPNTTLNGIAITGALNGGWYTFTPDAQPSGGNYNITLNLKGSSNTVAEAARYTIIKRDNNAQPWAVPGNYLIPVVNAGVVIASATGLTSFSDFAIGTAATVLAIKLDYTFKNTIAGANWNEAGNWNSNAVPGISDTAKIPAGAQLIISGTSAKAARLELGMGAKIQLTNTTDSLIISHSLQNAGSNEFTGNGTLVFKTATIQPTIITGGFIAAKIAFLGNTILPTEPILIKP